MKNLRVGVGQTFAIGGVHIRLVTLENTPSVQRAEFDVIMPDRVRLVTPEMGRIRQRPPLRIARNGGQSIVVVWNDLHMLSLVTIERVGMDRVFLDIFAPQSLRIELLPDVKAAS